MVHGNLNNYMDARVFYISIKACGEWIFSVRASLIIILDIHLNPLVARKVI